MVGFQSFLCLSYRIVRWSIVNNTPVFEMLSWSFVSKLSMMCYVAEWIINKVRKSLSCCFQPYSSVKTAFRNFFSESKVDSCMVGWTILCLWAVNNLLENFQPHSMFKLHSEVLLVKSERNITWMNELKVKLLNNDLVDFRLYTVSGF